MPSEEFPHSTGACQREIVTVATVLKDRHFLASWNILPGAGIGLPVISNNPYLGPSKSLVPLPPSLVFRRISGCVLFLGPCRHLVLSAAAPNLESGAEPRALGSQGNVP